MSRAVSSCSTRRREPTYARSSMSRVWHSSCWRVKLSEFILDARNNGLWKATGVYCEESDREFSVEGIAMADNNRFVALDVRHCDYDIHLHAFPRPARGSKNGIFLNALARLEAQCL
jgi:hypothetical protein